MKTKLNMTKNNSAEEVKTTEEKIINIMIDYSYKTADVMKMLQEHVTSLAARIEQLEGALKIVAEWDLPKTGKTWESGGEMSYEAAFGTNGSRDYMKQIASNALLPSPPTKTE